MLLAASFLEVLLSAPRGGSEGRDDETTMDHLSATLLLILLGSGCSDAATELLLRRSYCCCTAAAPSLSFGASRPLRRGAARRMMRSPTFI